MRRRLATPGPTEVPQELLLAGAREIVHHRSPDMRRLLIRLDERLQFVFRTERPVFISAMSGTGAMEAAVANLFGPGDRVLVVSNGYFGERFESIVSAYGAESVVVRSPWGTSVSLDDVISAHKENPDIAGLLVVHSETSTGVLNDVESIGRYFADTDVVVVVDSISGLVTHELETDAWSLDIVLGASHKGFSLPPGLAFVTVSERAWSQARRTARPVYYWAFERLAKFHPMPPSSPAVSLLNALDVSLDQIISDGLPTIQRRYARMAAATLSALEAIGFTPFVRQPSTRNHVITSVLAPDGIDTGTLMAVLEDRWAVTMTGGQGEFTGKLLRLGHVGATDDLDLIALLGAVELGVAELTDRRPTGVAVATYLESLAEEVLDVAAVSA